MEESAKCLKLNYMKLLHSTKNLYEVHIILYYGESISKMQTVRNSKGRKKQISQKREKEAERATETEPQRHIERERERGREKEHIKKEQHSSQQLDMHS